ncbi:uncharacterized protein [Drosophila tropicalis]|uniref:uncharacterized protein isoform X2 n=2 Tax=Drosophila tropicalis TaxID=46794 RepID=UPI0035AC0EF5
MKYTEIIKLNKTALFELLAAKEVPCDKEASIYQLRALVKQVMAQNQSGESDVPEEQAVSPAVSANVLAGQLVDVVIEQRGVGNIEQPSTPDQVGANQSPTMSRETSVGPDANVHVRESAQASETDELSSILSSIELYTARKNLAELKTRVMELEENLGGPEYNCRMNLKDVETTVPKFSGDGDLSIHVWIRELEKAARVYVLSDAQCWSLGNRLLEGSAKAYMTYEKTTTWSELKDALVKVFGLQMTNYEIANQMRKRSIGKGESLLQYFIIMRNIAQQGNFEDTDVVKYIVDGLQDRTGLSAPLYYCTSLNELREKMMRFQSVQPPAKNYVPQARQTSDRLQAITPAAKDKRCFNCRQIGHLMFDCPRPERPKGSCYRCFKVGHQYRNCPMRTQIAAMSSSEDPDTIDDKSFIQLVS